MAAVFAGLLFTDRLNPLVAMIGLGGGLIGCLGLLDDHRSISAAVRFGFEAVVAAMVVAAGLGIQATGITAVDGLLTIIWIVGLTNALNLLDNMDGLAAGVSAAAATAILALAVLGGQPVTAVLAAGVAGACIGFLAYNKRPASIFMGDAGSLFLGFVLAVTSLGLSPTLTPSASFAVSLMLLALPVLDTITVTVARLRRRRSVFVGGKDHLSHRLVACGLSPGAAVGLLVAVEAAMGMLAVLAGRGWWPLLDAVVAAAAALAGLTLVTARAQVYEEPIVAVGYAGRATAVVSGTADDPTYCRPPAYQSAECARPSGAGILDGHPAVGETA